MSRINGSVIGIKLLIIQVMQPVMGTNYFEFSGAPKNKSNTWMVIGEICLTSL